jgi:hypothetical protein
MVGNRKQKMDRSWTNKEQKKGFKLIALESLDFLLG